MSPRSRRLLIVLLVILLAVIALLFARCRRTAPAVAAVTVPPATEPAAAETVVAASAPAAPRPAEVISPATIEATAEIAAGKPISIRWTGPNNAGDYITVVRKDAADATYDNYAETKQGNPVEVPAPVDAGDYEIRYVTAQSKTVLGRAPIVVLPTPATLAGPDEAVLGTTISVTWTGPNNLHDYITVVARSTPDGQYGNFTETATGSPLNLTLPVEPGDAEIRYMTGTGARVLARRPLRILTPEVSLTAPDRVTAGTDFNVSWVGPNNPNDYVTIVPQGVPDGRYQNYTPTAKGSPLALTALITPGPAELRYMTGAGSRVLARRAVEVVAAAITLDAPSEAVAGAAVPIRWTGPNNRGDYLTIVPRTLPDGQYARYSDTSKGSPLTVECPIEPGETEIRYVSGQGAKVLARRPLRTTAPHVTLQGPAEAAAGSTIAIEWTGPASRGDYLTVVPKSARDGVTHQTVLAARGSPARLRVPDAAGAAEIRYMSGQDNRVLARAELVLSEKK